MNKIPFEDGTKTQEAYVPISGQNYEVVPAVWTGPVPLSAQNLNKMQDNIETKMYRLNIETAVSAGGQLILPCYYKVGTDCLKVRLGSEVLIKAIDNDNQGHYYEVGTVSSISNTIKLTSDWSLDVGDVIILEVQGVYENDTE